MIRLVEQAIAELNKLPASDQDAIAAMILAEINDERRWNAAFADSQDQLAKVADKVCDNIRAGRLQELTN